MSNTPNKIISDWLAQFEQGLYLGKLDETIALFRQECFWRDLVTFTWNIKTMEGKKEIFAMLKEVLPHVCPHKWEMIGEATEEEGVVSGAFTFETVDIKGEGYLRLIDGKCWTLLTTAKVLKGYEEKECALDVKEIYKNKKYVCTQNSHSISNEDSPTVPRKYEKSEHPYCIIIGGGQCGIALGARLKQLNVPTIIFDKNERPGDSWRNRYQSLCLHDPVWTHHLPYVSFPEDWPVFPDKDQLGDWLEAYTHAMGLDYWPSSECLKAHYHEAEEKWEVLVNCKGEKITLYSTQLVIATGMSGFPFIPKFPGAENFKGEHYHSTHFKKGSPYVKKKCLVLGSGTSAHDICVDLYQHGALVTMIQPSSSSVVRLDTLMEYNFKKYSNIHIADLIGASTPYKVKTSQSISLYKKIKQKDSVFYEQLRSKGFLLDFGEDESGVSMKYHRRGSGYYFNVGASELIIERKIGLKSGHNISQIYENSVVFTDGSELPADLIVYATGFSSMSDWIATLISPEVAEKIGLCWGIGSNTKKDPGPWEGELRNMWKPTKQNALWIHGGNLAQSRFYSLILALQIKARSDGLKTPVYG